MSLGAKALLGCGVLLLGGLTVMCCCAGYFMSTFPKDTRGRDFSGEIDLLFNGDIDRVREAIGSLGKDRRRAVVLKVLRNAEVEDVYIHPMVPEGMLSVARSNCAVPEDEQILGMIDSTITSSGKDALLFGEDGIYFHNDWAGEPPGAGKLPYGYFPSTVFNTHKYDVNVGDGCAFSASGCSAEPVEIASLLSQITEALLTEIRTNNSRNLPAERGLE